MTCFLRRSDGTLLMGAVDGSGYRSKDGGQTFAAWQTPHLRGLAERDGVIFAATSNVVDGYAVAMTTDEGATWKPLLRLQDIQGPADCVKDACAAPFAALIAQLNAAAPADMQVPPDMSSPSPQRSGCHCSFSPADADGRAAWVSIGVLLLGIVARRVVRR